MGAIHNNHMTPQLTDDVIPVQSVKLAQEVELPLAVGQERMYRRLDGNKQGFPCKLDTVLSTPPLSASSRLAMVLHVYILRTAAADII